MIQIRGEHLAFEEVWRAIDGEEVVLAPEARERVQRARTLVERMVAQGVPVYGVTTGFGHLASVSVGADDAAALQTNLVRTHAAGVGPPLAREVVRGMMLLRANTLAKGYSGIRPVVLERFLAFLNSGLTPQVPAQGSVGASGDLAPLAHLALAIIGEGRSELDGELRPTRENLERLGLEPLTLTAKEGLALTNGTQMMAAIGVLALREGRDLLRAANLTGALTLQALQGLPTAFDADLLQLRPHPGALRTGSELRDLLEGSRLTTAPGEVRMQDAYSLRCMPQVHGAVDQALRHVSDVLAIEINSATDNPLLLPERGEALSGGNFHGQPVALALDYMTMALTELGNISERRTERLVNPLLSGLPPFLAREAGVESGLMLAQYTAAAVSSENKTLSHPASVDSIPTSGNQEDFVSMGAGAATKLRRVVENVWRILGIEAICACQAVDHRDPGGLSLRTRPFYDRLRAEVEFFHEGILADVLEAGERILRRSVREGGSF